MWQQASGGSVSARAWPLGPEGRASAGADSGTSHLVSAAVLAAVVERAAPRPTLSVSGPLPERDGAKGQQASQEAADTAALCVAIAAGVCSSSSSCKGAADARGSQGAAQQWSCARRRCCSCVRGRRKRAAVPQRDRCRPQQECHGGPVGVGQRRGRRATMCVCARLRRASARTHTTQQRRATAAAARRATRWPCSTPP
jgi:hypothetical protein